MQDRRYEILKPSILKMDEREVVKEEDATDAMDIYMKEICLNLLDYVWNKVQRLTYNSPGFITKEGEVLTKEQLFENFL
jgi:hypothetical protein